MQNILQFIINNATNLISFDFFGLISAIINVFPVYDQLQCILNGQEVAQKYKKEKKIIPIFET